MPAHSEYRSEWIKAGYHARMGSARVTLPPPKDRVRLYHFTTAEYAISNLALSRLKVARFSDVNDPFELLALNFRERSTREVVKNFKETQNNRAGLLSFSRNWTNPVLWSHYAAKHQGICLGFDVLVDRVQRVSYQDKRLLAQLDEDEDPTKIGRELQATLRCTKSNQWNYEQEVRMFVKLKNMRQEGPLYFCPFGKRLRLREVILGPLCAAALATVRELVDAHHSDTVAIKSRLAYKSFTVVPQESTIP